MKKELKCKDVEFKEVHVILKIRKSKTDVDRSVRDVLISQGPSSAYPQVCCTNIYGLLNRM